MSEEIIPEVLEGIYPNCGIKIPSLGGKRDRSYVADVSFNTDGSLKKIFHTVICHHEIGIGKYPIRHLFLKLKDAEEFARA